MAAAVLLHYRERVNQSWLKITEFAGSGTKEAARASGRRETFAGLILWGRRHPCAESGFRIPRGCRHAKHIMIQLTSAGKHFGSQTLFEDLNWVVGPVDRVGLVGGNGTGKTTLL